MRNALNFSDKGYVKLSVALAKRRESDLVIKIAVEDSGIGIEADKQQEIFVQFKRLVPSYIGIYKGAGLGLAIVKKFIDELQSKIYVENELKKGSKFTCFIPLRESLIDDSYGSDNQISEQVDKKYERTFAEEVAPSVAVSTAVVGKNKILIVEDDFIAGKAGETIISGLNCHVDLARDGKQHSHS